MPPRHYYAYAIADSFDASIHCQLRPLVITPLICLRFFYFSAGHCCHAPFAAILAPHTAIITPLLPYAAMPLFDTMPALFDMLPPFRAPLMLESSLYADAADAA